MTIQDFLTSFIKPNALKLGGEVAIPDITTPTYKVYTALLSQTGTASPTTIVLQNTIGNISIAYESAGRYRIVGDDVFPFDKTYVSPYGFSPLLDLPDGIWTEVLGTNEIQIYSFSNADGADGQLNYTPIEVRLYN
jgi:hypothetical protein